MYSLSFELEKKKRKRKGGAKLTKKLRERRNKLN